ncbi:hypothetical protein [Nocardia sp. alder85J]|uniref:hypothetical protein n=1 Tax=Nocardia sp. alder85J TaxID=2862949 RepID=UPI001CD70EE5|nr:hypothetical protein [Nocardia sp. alder85J]MCX4095460.1 hypothetical protein [Nocardia sp. alder85J]
MNSVGPQRDGDGGGRARGGGSGHDGGVLTIFDEKFARMPWPVRAQLREDGGMHRDVFQGNDAGELARLRRIATGALLPVRVV